MSRNSDKPQVATVIFNAITKQFFVTFNDYDTKVKGLSRPKGNYKWIKKRQAEIKAGTVPLERTPSVLHGFDDGLMWAFEASGGPDNWSERRMKRRFELHDVKAVEKRYAAVMESKGFKNIRVYTTKGPGKTKWDAYNWGAWTLDNKTQKQLYNLFARLERAMNKEISAVVKNRAYYECSMRSTIKNKNDLWEFFKKEGVFEE